MVAFLPLWKKAPIKSIAHLGSCIRLRAERPTTSGRTTLSRSVPTIGASSRLLNIIDEFTHECLAIRLARRLRSIDVIDVLSDLFILRGVSGHIRSDNGPECVATAVQEWIGAVSAKTTYIIPGNPGRTGSSRVLMRACAMSYSTAGSSTPCAKPRLSSKAGAVTTMPFVHTPRSATALPPRKCSSPRSPHGRLRNPDQLRRPCSSWRHSQP
jgi:hypothetical protein